MLTKFLNFAHSFYERHRYLVIVSILLTSLLAVVFPYLIDSSLPSGFSAGDLSGDLRSFFINNYLIKTWGAFYPPWEIFSSLPNYGLSVFSVFHYLFFLILNGNIIYTYKLYIIFEIFACGISMLLVTFKLTKNGPGSIVAALFYSLTPYFQGELVSHIYFIWSYILLPPAYYLIYKALTLRSAKLAIFAGGTVALATIFAYLQNVYVTGLFMAVFALLIAFFYAEGYTAKSFFKSVLSRLWLLAIMVITFLLLSAYLIFPSFTFNSILASANPYERIIHAEILSNSVLSSFSLADWAQPLIPFVILLPIFSACLLLLKKNKLFSILAIVGLLSVLMTLGAATPLFTFCSKYLPLFNLIRVPIRFSITACFVFSLMGGVLIGLILTKLKGRLIQCERLGVSCFHKGLIALGMVFLLIVPVTYVLIESNLAYSSSGPLMHSSSQSSLDSAEAYTKIERFLDQEDPQNEYRVIDMASTNGQILSFDHKTLSGYLIPLDLFFMAYDSPSFGKILSLYGVKYIITVDSESEYIGWNQLSYSDLNNALSSSFDFKKVYQINDLVIFANQVTKPWLYPAYGALTVGGPQTLSLFYSLNATENWALMYANQVAKKGLTPTDLESFGAIIFHNSDIRDLSLLQNNNFMQPWKSIDIYNTKGWDIKRTDAFPIDHPFFNVQNSIEGQNAYSEFFAYTSGANSLKTSFDVEESGVFSVWVRALKVNGTGSITVTLDSNQTKTASFDGGYGFNWVKTNPVTLEKGSHCVLITNNDDTPLYLDTVAPISNEKLMSDVSQLSLLINESNLKTLYLLEFAKQFSTKGASIASPMLTSSDDSLVLHPNATAKTGLFIVNSGIYTLGIRVMTPSGNLKLSIDNETVYEGNNIQNGSPYWKWIITKPISIVAGDHIMEVYNSNVDTTLDFMYITSDTVDFQNEDPASSMGASPSPFIETNIGEINFTQTGLTEWEGNVNLNQRAFLVFLESYYGNSWSFQLGNKTLYPTPASYVFNAFPINTIDEQPFRINYAQSNLIAVSNLVSIVTFLIICMIAVYSSLKIHRLRIKKPAAIVIGKLGKNR